MQKLLPAWLFLLCLLLGALFTVAFAWSVKSTVTGVPRFGALGKAAVAIASFPDTARLALSEVSSDPDTSFRVPRTKADLSAFHPLRARPGIRVAGPVVKVNEAALARAPGWRVLVGSFVIDGEFSHGALALSPELEIVKVWKLPERDIAGQDPHPPYGKFIHGFALMKDGSVIYSFDVGVSLQRFDACGHRVWSIGGDFHHAVALDADQKFAWSLRDEDRSEGVLHAMILRVDTATGAIVKRISMDDIMAANPALHILDIRSKDDNWANGNPRTQNVRWLNDPFHLNDVEPLPTALAEHFAALGFNAGDLLVSARSLNLIFVVDPQTLHVKWWHIGAWRRQHDADWLPTGEISVYDNRMDLGYSRIVAISPATENTRVLFDGRTADFYSRIRGKQQLAATGNLLISSPQQGRAFEVAPDGQMLFEVYNPKPGSTEFNYPISEVTWFPSDAFDPTKDFSCAK